MKFKFLQSEFEFDKDDAKIAVPLALLALGMAFTPISKAWLLAGAGIYYLLLFYLNKLTEPLKKWLKFRAFKCPYCRSTHTVFLGLQDYLGDIPHYWYRCNECGEESFRSMKGSSNRVLGSANSRANGRDRHLEGLGIRESHNFRAICSDAHRGSEERL